MTTNRQMTMALNRVCVSDEESRKNQGRLDEFIQQGGNELVRGPIRVYNNVFTSLFRLFRVMPGTAVVVIGNGQVLKVLSEGSYHALSFPVMSRIDLFVVNVRECILNIETTKELNLFYQPAGKDATEGIPIQVDLHVSANYQVVQPDRIALYVDQPVTMLYDTILESMRSIVAYTRYRDFQAGGNAGYMIAQQLQQRGVEANLGIRVSNVQITHLSGAQELDRAMMDAYIKPQTTQIEAQIEAIRQRNQMQLDMERATTHRDISQMIELTPAYVAQFLPDQYERIFGNRALTDQQRLQALTDLARAGMLGTMMGDGDNMQAFQGALQHMLTGVPPAPPQPAPPLMGSAASQTGLPPQLGGGSGSSGGSFAYTTGLKRLQEEVSVMLDQGWNASLKNDAGTFYVYVRLSDTQTQQNLDIYFLCTTQYPQQPPTMFLELNGIQQSYTPTALMHWTPQTSLIDLVGAVVTAYQ